MQVFTENQRDAVKAALNNNISIITGPPGVGKSFVLRGIAEVYSILYPDNHIYLAAPTGRAAKRMSEATGRPASTIHRLLRYNPNHGGFEYGHGNKLDGPGIILIDEFSMVDIELAYSLFAAIDNHQVVMIGDDKQLPSVGPGSVLKDCMESGVIPCTRLNVNFRQARGSVIVTNAYHICSGRVPDLITNNDFEFIPVEDGDQATQQVLASIRSLLADGVSENDIQVLAPMYKGKAGINRLNTVIRDALNPKIDGQLELCGYRVGDRILVTKNNYALGVLNGDIGFVVDVTKNMIVVDFDDFSVDFTLEDMEILKLGYAISVHKSQGSEFPYVIMPLVNEHFMMLQRQILYTSITRAQKRLILIANETSVKRAIKNNNVEERYSGLVKRIRGSDEMNEKHQVACSQDLIKESSIMYGTL